MARRTKVRCYRRRKNSPITTFQESRITGALGGLPSPGVSRRGCFVLALLALLSGCGVPNADSQRATVLSKTCSSTIARNGLPAPVPSQIDSERFAEERRRLLATGKRFNTVSPYRNICNAIRKELRATITAVAAETGEDTDTGEDTETGDAEGSGS